MMDNAGGHGSNEAVEKYTEDLKNKYKIEIIQQVPRSPETNVLDLGICLDVFAVGRRKGASRSEE